MGNLFDVRRQISIHLQFFLRNMRNDRANIFLIASLLLIWLKSCLLACKIAQKVTILQEHVFFQRIIYIADIIKQALRIGK